MPREVLTHILEVTDARPRGPDRWMGHGLCHGSKRNRDLSIRVTSDRILLHDFAGCEPSQVVATLGLELRDLFLDSPSPRGQRPTPRPVRVDRVAVAFQFELAALDRRLRAEKILDLATDLDIATVNEDELDRVLGYVAQAYRDNEQAILFAGVADGLREKDFAERISHDPQTPTA